jgi:hypothetical protein
MAAENQDPSPGDTDNNLLRKILLRLKSFIGGGSVPVPLPVIVEPGDIEIGAIEIKNSTNDDRAEVLNVCPGGADFGLVTRNIPCGVQPVSGTVSVGNFPSPVLVDSIGQVSTNNSTTTPLAGNGLFVGISDDLLNWKSVHITFQSDVSAGGLIGGLQIQFSTDNVTWVTFHRFTYVASGVKIITVPAYQRYFRLTYSNGATPQSTFNLNVVLKSESSEFAVNAPPDDTGGFFNPPGAVLVRNIPSGTQLVDGSAVSQPVTATKGTLTNRSGSVTLGGTSQQVMAANATRKYLLFENISTEDMYINFTAAALADDASIKIVPNGSYILEDSFISTEAVNVVSATTGSKFVAKEG